MSVVLDKNSSNYLNVTLASGERPIPDDYVLVTGWLRWNSTYSRSTNNSAWEIQSSDGGTEAELRAQVRSAGNGRVFGHRGGSANKTSAGGTINDDTWYLVCVSMVPDDGSTGRVSLYIDSSTRVATRTFSQDNGDTLNLDQFYVGKDSGGSPWGGYIADVAIFTPANQTEAEAIIDEIINSGGTSRAANNLPTYTPDWYAPLLDDNVAEGTNLTENGTITYSTSIHPTLETAGGADVTLDAASSGAATLSIDLDVDTALEATSSGVASLSIDAAIDTALAATSAGAGTVSADGAVDTALVAASSAAATISAHIVAGDDLTGSVSAAASLSATLSVDTVLAATSAGVSTVTAGAVLDWALASTVNAVATITGHVIAGDELSGASTGTATITANLGVDTVLGSTVSAAATVVATGLASDQLLDATVAAIATISADMVDHPTFTLPGGESRLFYCRPSDGRLVSAAWGL